MTAARLALRDAGKGINHERRKGRDMRAEQKRHSQMMDMAAKEAVKKITIELDWLKKVNAELLKALRKTDSRLMCIGYADDGLARAPIRAAIAKAKGARG